jgi:class 3 adenylate cyclase/tetratricopeptide (TPR) repeat protein
VEAAGSNPRKVSTACNRVGVAGETDSYNQAVPVCAACSEENPERAHFCLRCGTSLAQPVPERRKLATLLFCDVSGSTAMGESLDAEAVRDLMFRYFDDMRATVERHGGTVEKFIGDAVMAVFGVPTAHEDDALRACRAASEMQARLVELNDDLEELFGTRLALRIGVNTGEIVAGDAGKRETMVTGDAVNVAARIEQAAKPGEVLLGAPTYRLVRTGVEVEPLEPVAVKGKAQAVAAYRLIAVAGPRAPAHLTLTPMVGRERELLAVAEVFRRAVAERSCHAVTIVGEPGVGKSRLAAEFAHAVAGEATVLSGRCLSYGEGLTFWPIGEIVRGAAAIRDDDSPAHARDKLARLLADEGAGYLVAQKVAQAVGLEGGSAPAAQIAWAISRFFEALARERPLVVVVDDIHWAEPLLLDLLASLPRTLRDAPVLLLCVGRPELEEVRGEWTTALWLEPLAAEDSARLIENRLGAAVSAAALERITAAVRGNPLFAEELSAMLVEEGVLQRDDSFWVAARDLTEIDLPPTITALLGARLDRLGAERATLERGSVEGEVFHRGAVAALSAPETRAGVDAHLDLLAQKGLIRTAPASFRNDVAFAFRHILVRDSAYRATPKRVRAELHAAFAVWLERIAGDRIIEYEEILGYHLEQAHRYELELGPPREKSRQLGREAAHWLSLAGHRALERADIPAAINLLSRAEVLAPDDRSLVKALPDLGVALIEAGEFEQARPALARVIKIARRLGNRGAEWHAIVKQSWLDLHTNARGRGLEEIRREAEQAIAVFDQLDDDLGLARGWRLVAEVENMSGHQAARRAALEQVVEHAERAGDQLEAGLSLVALGSAMFWGPTPVREAIRRCNEVLEQADEEPIVEAGMLATLALFEAMRGRVDAAREHLAQREAAHADLGLKHDLAGEAGSVRGPLEMLAGDLTAAERELRLAFDACERMGDTSFLSTVSGTLGQVSYAQGRYEDAGNFAKISKETAAADDRVSQILWRCVEAKALARRGEFELAEALARESLALCETTDFLVLHGDALMDLGEVLRLEGRVHEASEALEAALRVFDKKEALVSASRARKLLNELAPT